MNVEPLCKGAKESDFPPTPKDVEVFARQRGFADPLGFAKYFTDYYTLSNWCQSNGKPMRNWRQVVMTWELTSKQRDFSPRKKKLMRQMTEEEYEKTLRE